MFFFQIDKRNGKKLTLFVDFLVFDALEACFRGRGELSLEVRLDDEACHRSGQIGTETSMLDIDADGYLRIIHRGEGDKHGMILAWVLDGTRLATDG
jgi:hypothetical protein